jgi:glutamine amidotransferase-like uncharacterized protein
MAKDILVFGEHPASTGSLIPSLKSAFPHHALRKIGADDLRHGALDDEQAGLLVLPGITGEVSLYPQTIGEDGLKRIRSFIEKKGVVLTICAATYFVCRETRYTPPWGPAKGRMSINHLFNAAAIGPLPSFARQATNDPKYGDVSVIPVQFKTDRGEWRDAHVCYGNGPALYPDPSEHHTSEILATFSGQNDNAPALIRKVIGKGAVYMSCIHPEIAYQDMRAQRGLDDAARVMTALQPHEQGRHALWKNLTDRIKRDMRP